ncbi:fluoride efflux transporter FluC [Isoptericola sp. NPDC057191]|uniref:fluoride efflux transporter FluC n=1 Tax=Isoptericola sp. NPDC057191 TaxID=3346041 RepID=UPI0036343356
MTAGRPPALVRPAHRRPGLVALVAAGGAVGTAARYGLTQAWPAVHGWPVATFTANLVGAFVLGWLLEALAARGPETTGVQRVRLAVGTGVLGGFTTFSSLALETERLLTHGSVALAVVYAGATLLLGYLACLGGVLLGADRRAR